MYSARCAEVAANYFAEIDQAPEPPTLDPLVAAEAARLRYVSAIGCPGSLGSEHQLPASSITILPAN